MKKKLLLFMCLILGLFVGCSKVKQGPRAFTVGFDAEFPPYGFMDSKTGIYRGFDLDLAEEVCKRNNWVLIKRPINWDAKDAELQAGTIDCIWNGFTITPERKDKYTWSEVYVRNEQLIVVKQGSAIKSLEDLKGKRLVAQDGSSGAEAIKTYEKSQTAKDKSFAFKEVRLVPDYLAAALMLRTGAVDAIAVDGAVSDQILAAGKNTFRVLDEKLCDEHYGIGFKLGNTALRDKVQATLKEMVKDGTAEQICRRWATEEVANGGAKIHFILTAEPAK